MIMGEDEKEKNTERRKRQIDTFGVDGSKEVKCREMEIKRF